MKKSLGIAVLFTVPLIFSAAPALARFAAGEYTATIPSGPSDTETATQCLFFIRTGAVAGFPNSGQWDSPTTGVVLAGNYVFDTGYLRLYATYDNGGKALNGYVRTSTGSGGFDEWTVSAYPIAAIDDGEVTLARGCSDALKATRHPGDPTK